MAGYGNGACYHRSARSKEFIAAKIAALVELDFIRTPADNWRAEQRAHFEEWYPGDLDVATEMVADARLPNTLRRLGILNRRHS